MKYKKFLPHLSILTAVVLLGGLFITISASRENQDRRSRAAETASTPCQQGPTVITKGGTYSGCWESHEATASAIRIATAEPVTLTNCTIKGKGRLIGSFDKGGTNYTSHVKLTLNNCNLLGLYPDAGFSRDRAIAIYNFDYVDIQHNYFEQNGGIYLHHWSGTQTDRPAVTVKFNKAKNIDGRISNGAGGYSGKTTATFTQFNDINAPGIEIAWNEVHNIPFESSVEDNINMYKSSGTEASPIDIHDNYIEGAYPNDPTLDGYSGGGILLGDGGTGSWQISHDNQAVGTSNYGVAIMGGNNNKQFNNRAISSGLLPDGRTIKSQNVGLPIWNFYKEPTFASNSAYTNILGWYRPITGIRADSWLPDCSGNCTNTSIKPGQPITREDEIAEKTFWQNKVAAAGVIIGPTSTITVHAAGATTTTVWPHMKLEVNGKIVAEWDVQNHPSTGYQPFTYTGPGKILPNQIKVFLTNNTGTDNTDLYVDKMTLDGIDYQSESPNTYSLGGWNNALGGGCNAGYKQTQLLACNGYFHYEAAGTYPTATPTVVPTATAAPIATPTPTEVPTPTPTSIPTPTPTKIPPTPTPTSITLVNLARNKPVTAGSIYSSAYAGSKAVDGNTGTYWISKSTNRWITVDLGTLKNVSKFVIKHYTGTYITKNFSILTSSDNITWTTVATVTNNTLSTTTHPISTKSARYIRLNVTTPAQNTYPYAFIRELEVY